MVAVSDDFNRPNGPIGSNWVMAASNPSQIVNNALAGSSSTQLGIRHVTPVATDDMFVQAKWLAGANTGVALAQPAFTTGATVTSGQYYAFRQNVSQGRPAIVHKAAGASSLTVLANSPSSVTMVSGDTMRLEYVGGVLIGYVNGVEVVRHTPATPITGQRHVGLVVSTTSSNGVQVLDDFSAGDIGAPVVPPSVGHRVCGAVTHNSATVATQVFNTKVAGVRVVYGTSPGLTVGTIVGFPRSADSLGFVKLPITDLSPDTMYYYAIEVYDGSAWLRNTALSGSFRTFPTPGTAKDLVFNHVHCHSEGFNNTVWDGVIASDGLFVMHCGDMNYEDFDDPTDTDAARAPKVEAYVKHFTASRPSSMYSSKPLMYTWDDHDGSGNNSDGTRPGWPNNAKIYRQVIPHYPLPATDGIGIWQEVQYGRIHFILLDLRSQRHPVGNPDNATKTILGAEQKQWLKDTMLNSSADLFVILSSVPWNDRDTTADGWGRYQTEQAELIDFFSANGMLDSIYIVTGDMHGVAADDGTNSPGGIPNVIAGAIGSNASEKGGPWSVISSPGNYRFGRTSFVGNTPTFTAFHHDTSTTTVATMTVPLSARATGPTIGVWDGTVVVPATAGVWDGAAVVPATISVT